MIKNQIKVKGTGAIDAFLDKLDNMVAGVQQGIQEG